MDQKELRAAIGNLTASISAEVPKNLAEEKFAEALLVGLSVFGELLIDIKRIADAAERAPVVFTNVAPVTTGSFGNPTPFQHYDPVTGQPISTGAKP